MAVLDGGVREAGSEMTAELGLDRNRATLPSWGGQGHDQPEAGPRLRREGGNERGVNEQRPRTRASGT